MLMISSLIYRVCIFGVKQLFCIPSIGVQGLMSFIHKAIWSIYNDCSKRNMTSRQACIIPQCKPNFQIFLLFTKNLLFSLFSHTLSHTPFPLLNCPIPSLHYSHFSFSANSLFKGIWVVLQLKPLLEAYCAGPLVTQNFPGP